MLAFIQKADLERLETQPQNTRRSVLRTPHDSTPSSVSKLEKSTTVNKYTEEFGFASSFKKSMERLKTISSKYNETTIDSGWTLQTMADLDFFRIEINVALFRLAIHGSPLGIAMVQLSCTKPRIEGHHDLLTVCTGAIIIQVPYDAVTKEKIINVIQKHKNMTVTAHSKPELLIHRQGHLFLSAMVDVLVKAEITKGIINFSYYLEYVTYSILVIITSYGMKSPFTGNPFFGSAMENVMKKSFPLQIITPPTRTLGSTTKLPRTNYYDIGLNFKYNENIVEIPLFSCENSKKYVFPSMYALHGVGNYGSVVKYQIRNLSNWPVYLPLPIITVYPRIVHRYKSFMSASSYESMPKTIRTGKLRLQKLENLFTLIKSLLLFDDQNNITKISTVAPELNGFRIEYRYVFIYLVKRLFILFFRVYSDTPRIAWKLLQRHQLLDPKFVFRLCNITMKKIPLKDMMNQASQMITSLKSDPLFEWTRVNHLDNDVKCKLAQTMNMFGIFQWKWRQTLERLDSKWWEDQPKPSWLPTDIDIKSVILDFREYLECPILEESLLTKSKTDIEKAKKHMGFSGFFKSNQKKFISSGKFIQFLFPNLLKLIIIINYRKAG